MPIACVGSCCKPRSLAFLRCFYFAVNRSRQWTILASFCDFCSVCSFVARRKAFKLLAGRVRHWPPSSIPSTSLLILGQTSSRRCASFFAIVTWIPTLFTFLTVQDRTTQVACLILAPVLIVMDIALWFLGPCVFSNLPMLAKLTLSRCRPIQRRSNNESYRFFVSSIVVP